MRDWLVVAKIKAAKLYKFDKKAVSFGNENPGNTSNEVTPCGVLFKIKARSYVVILQDPASRFHR